MSRPQLLLWALVGVALLAAPAAASDEDPLERATTLKELGFSQIDAGSAMDDPKRIKKGLLNLKEARRIFEEAAKADPISAGLKSRIERNLEEIEDGETFAKRVLEHVEVGKDEDAAKKKGADGEAPWGDPIDPEQPGEKKPEEEEPEIHAPPPTDGERIGPWCKRIRKLYDETDSPTGRASLARQMAKKGGVLALPQLFDLFKKEQDENARDGVHEALAIVGTSRVAREMGRYASTSKEKHWENALDVIYRCLEKPEKEEPEKPFMRAIREFHELKIRKLSLKIITHLDEMGGPGIAALGEVIYVKDFGYHNHVIELLSNKKSSRAVPPLVFKMNRFKFEYRAQMPAHKALLKMGYYAVPELINRLNDRAAGIWISWTLRKITGETMGTHKRKWHDWWKTEKLRHPELFDDPDERPPVVTGN